MGREKGFLALAVGLAAGAEIILVPEIPFRTEDILAQFRDGRKKGKRSMIAVVAEGAVDVSTLAKEVQAGYPGEVRYSILGYVQRGGAPSARSRRLAFLFGARAVEALAESRGAVFVGLEANKVVTRNLLDVYEKKELDQESFRLAHILAA
jgi:6-phosphofructokinase 1